MMAQISSDLHGVGIKLKTTQPIIFYNVIKMCIVLELSTEDGQFQVLYILCLVFLSAGKYIFNQLQHLTSLMDKLDACTRLSIKIRLSGDTWNPYHTTLVHQQYTGNTAQVIFLLLKLEWLLLELIAYTVLSALYKNNLTNGLFIPKYEKSSVISADMCTKPYSGPIISQSTNCMTGFRFYPTSDT